MVQHPKWVEAATAVSTVTKTNIADGKTTTRKEYGKAARVELVLPLRSILPRKSFAALITKGVLPMLSKALRSVDINPANQSLDTVNAVWAWHSLVAKALDKNPSKKLGQGQGMGGTTGSAASSIAETGTGTGTAAMHLCALWEGDFFPKLLATLHAWLRQADGPDAFKQIEAWYRGWKSYFANHIDEISKDASTRKKSKKAQKAAATSARRQRRAMEQLVDRQFKKCLDMIRVRMQDGAPGLAKATVPDPKTTSYSTCLNDALKAASVAAGHWQQQQQQQHPSFRQVKSTDPVAGPGGRGSGSGSGGGGDVDRSVTFREVLEQLASENGVEFTPNFKRGRDRSSGKQVYDFGSVSVYIDRDVVYALNPLGANLNSSGEKWEPISTSELLQRCKEPKQRQRQQRQQQRQMPAARATTKAAPSAGPASNGKQNNAVPQPDGDEDDVEDID